MSKVLILGAAGTLGRYVTGAALNAGHEVTGVLRPGARLPDHLRERVAVRQADLLHTPMAVLAAYAEQHDVVINTAGRVTDGPRFVELTARVVTALEFIHPEARPVAWFLAGAALLDLDERGRRGVDLPRVARAFWPHRANFERLARSPLDWRVLCPGPLVHHPALGTGHLRLSIDRLPVPLPGWTHLLPGPLTLPFLAHRVPEMTVPYGDAAAVIVANLARASDTSRHRVGLALPAGMRLQKDDASPMRGAA